jgi:hypothetical protein
LAAWGMTGASMEEPKPAMKATEAVRAFVAIFFQSWCAGSQYPWCVLRVH